MSAASPESSVAAKKKRQTDSNPSVEGDHRKRRRNRTTQSCLNCHTSKRMCDRKRPACARCTQLGLTGLCVYEVDDPSQRTDTQDESSRLLKRVAELEGVIRELKNKPHPRWVQAATTNEDFDKWHCRSHGLGPESSSASSSAPSPPTTASPPSERIDPNSLRSPLTPFASISVADMQQKSPYRQHTPMDTPSPALMTPTDEYPLSHVGIVGQNALSGLSQDYDLTSMFLSYSGLMGCPDTTFSNDSFPKHAAHCGCLHEATTYNTMLELSLRLRKAYDVLSRYPHHHLGSQCILRQRLAELDNLATNALADITTPPGDLSDALLSSDRVFATPGPGPSFQAKMPAPPAGGPNLQGVRSWELMTSNASSPASLDDSFMTWEPSRRS